jgi:hypothetical protein
VDHRDEWISTNERFGWPDLEYFPSLSPVVEMLMCRSAEKKMLFSKVKLMN